MQVPAKRRSKFFDVVTFRLGEKNVIYYWTFSNVDDHIIGCMA